MKVQVDASGWKLSSDDAEATGDPAVAGASLLTGKPSSGVFSKVAGESAAATEEDLATTATEPAPSSDAAELEASQRFPAPAKLPTDLKVG